MPGGLYDLKGQIKITLTAIVSLLVFVILLQNSQTITLKILFWEASMPRIVLLGVTAAAGFAAGFLYGKRRT